MFWFDPTRFTHDRVRKTGVFSSTGTVSRRFGHLSTSRTARRALICNSGLGDTQTVDTRRGVKKNLRPAESRVASGETALMTDPLQRAPLRLTPDVGRPQNHHRFRVWAGSYSRSECSDREGICFQLFVELNLLDLLHGASR